MEEWRFIELSCIFYCLVLSGKFDNEGKVYDVDKFYEDSFWWYCINKYNNYYNKFDVLIVKGCKYIIGCYNINWFIL